MITTRCSCLLVLTTALLARPGPAAASAGTDDPGFEPRRVVPTVLPIVDLGLLEARVLQDSVGVEPAVVAIHPESPRAATYSRRPEGSVLGPGPPDKNGQVVDREASGPRDPVRGRAITGPLHGRTLEALPAIVSFPRAWQEFHPDSTSWKPPGPRE